MSELLQAELRGVLVEAAQGLRLAQSQVWEQAFHDSPRLSLEATNMLLALCDDVLRALLAVRHGEPLNSLREPVARSTRAFDKLTSEDGQHSPCEVWDTLVALTATLRRHGAA